MANCWLQIDDAPHDSQAESEQHSWPAKSAVVGSPCGSHVNPAPILSDRSTILAAALPGGGRYRRSKLLYERASRHVSTSWLSLRVK